MVTELSNLAAVTIPFTLSETRRVFICLPAEYEKLREMMSFPVLYLLHGSPGGPEDWLKMGDAQAILDKAAADKIIGPCIAVFPDGNGGLMKDTQYIDAPDGNTPMETFISKMLEASGYFRFYRFLFRVWKNRRESHVETFYSGIGKNNQGQFAPGLYK